MEPHRKYKGRLEWRLIIPISRNGNKAGNRIKIPKIANHGFDVCFGNLIPKEIIRFIGIVFLRQELGMQKVIWTKKDWYTLQLLIQLSATASKISSTLEKGKRFWGDGLDKHHNLAKKRKGEGKDNYTHFLHLYHNAWHDIFSWLTPQEAIRLIGIVFLGEEIGYLKRVWENKEWTKLQQMITENKKPFEVREMFWKGRRNKGKRKNKKNRRR